MSWYSVAPFLIVIAAVIVGDILCGDVTNNRQPVNKNPWSQLGNNNDAPLNPQWGSDSKPSTPWPALGQRRNQQQNNSLQNTQNQPMWIRPNNGPNWVRNTPPPSQLPNGGITRINTQGGNYGGVASLNSGNSGKANSNSGNFNTQFINNERGEFNQNQRPNVAKPVSSNPNQNINTSNMSGGRTSGTMVANPVTGTQNSNVNVVRGNSNIGISTQNQASTNRNTNGFIMGGTMKNTNNNIRGTNSMSGTGGFNSGIANQNLNNNFGTRGSGPMSPIFGSSQNQNQNLNTNNGMRGAIPTGSMNAGTGTSSQNENEESDASTSGDVNDNELREFSEQLLNKDTNNAAKHVTINFQGMTTSRSTNDEAPLPLLSIDKDAYSIPSIEKLILLYNNYILEANQNEVYTAQEKIEENNLLDTILSTPVMQHTRNFLIQKGKLGKDPKEFKDLLRLIWFGMYSRGGGRIGSSGFEHIFLAELKNNQVSGLHNWLYFNEEERNNNANYLGYLKKIDLGNKGAILKYHFSFHGVDKPVGSMFIGTSPELEMALYSACFVLRADKICPLKMNGNRFIIRTYTYRYRGKNMIGSAFPEI